MPPVRSVTAAKTVKTERTHEENQERAYIAASRRSDRSLEARIESARRASEIHKKRTGRALRVTEQDVVNEEMYEEEDDDLPAQYRRLTAHLQTNSMDFNRRLHAYLASQHATRTALASQYDQAFANNYAQQFPDAAHFSHQMMQPVVPAQMPPPQMFHQSPQSYRHAPYPMASNQGFRPNTHQRSASIATPQDLPFRSTYLATSTAETSRPDEHRRMSLPPQALHSPPQPQSDDQTHPSLSRSSSSIHSRKQEPCSPHHAFGNQPPTPPSYAGTPVSQPEPPTQPAYHFMPHLQTMFDSTLQHVNMSPFSMSLPAESQQLLGSALDPNDPHTPMMMAGSEMMTQPFYSYNPNPSSKSQLSNAAGFEVDQTLAPSAAIHVDTTSDGVASSNPPSATSVTTDGMITPYPPNFGYNFDSAYPDPFKSASLTRNNSAQGSTDAMTPGDWSSFVDVSVWETTPSQ
ncbi:hypothetical protein K432DRAFT_410663 [Lepidopterella palustris CBS 459.81]|uniref:Uncharacterized protein n=1 Tax=Lepidopterella palustris CBS 459.81 TaxID=1314670 RepID=A0A8E2DXE0_9PEZI|nr:hypothetical protein K432DRAFT_410663 [Lepidopterella palustris CBS 459.81]